MVDIGFFLADSAEDLLYIISFTPAELRVLIESLATHNPPGPEYRAIQEALLSGLTTAKERMRDS